MIDYPSSQSKAAGMSNMHYTKLLRAYARSMTTGNATNGSEYLGSLTRFQHVMLTS